MKKNISLFILSLFFIGYVNTEILAQCPAVPACNKTAVSGTSYTLTASDVLCVGTNYTSGSITINGGTVVVQSGGTLGVSPSISSGTIHIATGGTLSSDISAGSSATINNCGKISGTRSINPNVALNNYGNNDGALLSLKQDNGFTLNNYGKNLSVSIDGNPNGSFTINNGVGATITSLATTHPSSGLKAGSVITNLGAINLTSNMLWEGTINNGNATQPGAITAAAGTEIEFRSQWTINNNPSSTITLDRIYLNNLSSPGQGALLSDQSVLAVNTIVGNNIVNPIKGIGGCSYFKSYNVVSSTSNQNLFLQVPPGAISYCGPVPVNSAAQSFGITSVVSNGGNPAKYRVTVNSSNNSGSINNTLISIRGVTGNQTNGYWKATLISTTSGTATYDLSAPDGSVYPFDNASNPGTGTFYWTASTFGNAYYAGYDCNNPALTTKIVTAGPSQTACANNPTVTLDGTFSTAVPGIIWSGGAGTFVPNNTTKNATYTPTAAEITAGSVTLTITTTGSSSVCSQQSDKVTITYAPSPVANAGAAANVCVNNPAAVLTGTASNQTSVTWSGGTGTFTAPGSLTTTYNPSAAELAAAPKTITLTLTANKTGCSPVPSTVTVTINPTPVVNAGLDTTICRNDSFNLVGVVTHATGGTWSGGNGTFTPNANTLTANYKPSVAELAGASVTLTLTSTGNVSCTPVKDDMKIKFSPAPTITITGPTSVCDNNPSFSLKSAVTDAAGQSWLGSGGSFVPNTTANTVTYIPSAAEISLGSTGVVAQTTGGKCPSVTDTLIVTFVPAPKVSAGAPISICENNPTGTLTGSVTGIFSVTWTSPTGGLFSAPTNPVTNYTATSADIANGSVLLTVTANTPTCNPVTDKVLVTITAPPTVNAGPAKTVCANNATATFTGSFTGATGVLWTTAGDGTFGSPASATTTYTAGPNDIAAGTVTLTLTTTGNGTCLAVPATTKMIITPKPTVMPGTYSVCANNATVNLNASVTIATGGTWVGGAGTFSPGRNVLNPTYIPTSAEANSGSLSLTLQSTGNGNCTAVTGNATITFTPAPTVTPVTPANVCADVPNAAISTAETVATGVLWSGGSGTIASPTSLSTTYTPTTSEINSGSVVLTVTTTGNGTCSPVSGNLTVKIAPAPTVNAGPNQVVCGTVSTVSNLTGTVTGATGGSWTKVSGTGTFGNANNTSTTYTPSTQDITNGSVTLKLTSTGNGLCQPVSNTITITYTPVPSINAGVDQIVCSTELPVKLSATGSPASWNTSGGTFANAGSLITTYTPSAAEIAAGTVTLSISTLASGACPVKTSQLTITIPPGPIVNPGAATQTMCGSLAAYQLNGTVTNATGGIWSTNGTGSFSPNANTLNATYTPSATDRTTGSVVLTLTSTGNGFCQQVSKTVTLTITPAITVSAGPNQTLCADAGGITLNGAVTNATGGIWSVTSGTGSIASPTSLITTFTPSAADIAAGTVSFVLTSTGNGGCPAVTSTVTHTLTPAPTLSQGTNQAICGDSAYVQLNATYTVATGVKWTSNGTGTFSPNAATANARYAPSTADIAAGSVILTATTTGNGTCNPVIKTVTVTITPAVVLTIPSAQEVCQNNPTVSLTASTTATAVSWTTSGSGTFASPTSPSTTYAPSAADIAAGVVTLKNKTTGNATCKTQSGIIQVTIAPSPIVDAGLPQTVCSTVSSISLNGSVLHAGGGKWTSNGSGTFANANAPITTYVPSQADTTAGSVLFTLTSTGNGTCIPVSKNVTITFKKIAKVSAGPNQTICGDSAYVQLAGSVVNAGGGMWSKSGTGAFLPSTIDLNAVYSPTPADKAAGSVTITLTSTSNGECPAVSSSMVITITPAPKVTVSGDQTVCANNAVTNVSGTFVPAASSAIKWTTSGTGTFSPNNTSLAVLYTPSAIDKAAGSVVLAMSTTGNGTCKPAQGYLTLTITPAPTLNAGFDKTICGDSSAVKLNQAVVTTATGVQWSTNGTGVFGPDNKAVQPIYYPTAADKTAGKVKLAAVTTGNGSCLAVRDTIEITITPVPTVNAGTDILICADTNGVKLSGSSTIAGGVKWTSTGAGTFTPSAFVANATYIPSDDQTVTLTLTTTNNGTCKAVTDDVLVLVSPKPVVNAGTDTTVCANVTQVTLKGVVTNATGGQWTTNGSGTFAPGSSTLTPKYTPSASDLTVGNVILTLSSTGNGLCKAVSDNVNLTFNPVATLSAGNDLQACNTSTTVNVNASSTNISSVTWQIISGAGSLSSTSSLSTIYTVNPADITAGSVTLRITGTALAGCTNATDDVIITFVAAPPINAGADKSVCSTDFPIALEGTGSSAQWSGGTGSFSPNDQTLNALYTPSAAEIAAHTVTLTLQAITNGSCPKPSDQVTFTILDGPKVNVDAGTVSKICANTPSVNLTGSTNGINSTGVAWSTSGSGTFINGTSLTPVYTPSAADKNGGEVVLTISSTGNGVCNPATDTMRLVITPAPKITTGVDQIVCADAATVNISSTFSNATGVLWSKVTANGSFTNAASANTTYTVSNPLDTSAVSITIRVETTGQLASCPPATDEMTITFSKKPTVSAGAPITVCTDTTSIPLHGAVTIATGGVWSSPSGGTFIPSANQLNAKYIPSALDKTNGTVKLVLTSTGNGNCNAYTGNVDITLNPGPTISGSVPNDSICNGNTVSANANVTNATSLLWKTTGTGTFSTTTGSNTVYTPSPDDVSNGGVIIYASTAGSTPCKEVEKYFAITILKTQSALVNAGFDQTACADAGFFPLNGIIDGIAGTGIWTSSSGKGDFYPDATDLNPIFVPDQADIDAGGLTLTLSVTNTSICTPNPDSMILTITPAPVVTASGTAGPFPPLCADTAYIQLNPTITHASGGEWSTTGTGTFSPSMSTLNAVYVPSAADREKGLFGLTLTTTGNGTCNAYTDFITIRLTPKPTINAGPDKIVCADQQLVDLNATTTVATGVDWTTTGTSIFTAPANSLNTQYIMSDVDTTNRVFNIFAKTVNQGLCKSVYDTVKISVQPIPVVHASADQSVCADAGTIQVRAGISNGVGIVWTTNGSGSFSPDASSNPVTYNLSLADTSKASVELYATSVNSGICSSRTDTVKVTINPAPVVSAGAPIICEKALGAALNGAVLNGTGTNTWSSSGSGIFAVNNSVLGATYYPTAADISAGQVILTLTASDYGTCGTVSNRAVLLITPMPVADASADQYSCVGGKVTVSANTTQPGVSYSWTDDAGVLVQPANAKSHTFTVSTNTKRVLLATDQKGCISRDTVNITTFGLPAFGLPDLACYKENLIVQSNPVPDPTVPGIYQWFDNGSIMTGENKSFLIVPDTGTYKIEFSFANCSSDDQITVNPAPVIKATDIVACGAATLSASAAPSGTTISWSLNGSAQGSGTSLAIQSVAGDTTKYDILATNPATGCSNTDSAYVIGLPIPEMVQLDSTSCIGLTVRLTARPTNIPNLDQFTNVTFDWKKNGGAVFSLDSTIIIDAVGTYKGTITIDQCKDTSTNIIAYAAYPTSTLPDSYTYCPETDKKVLLDPGTLPNTTYVWNNGFTGSQNTVSPKNDSAYVVKITNQFFCSITDQTIVYAICAPVIDVPTAFTPGLAGSGDQTFRGFGVYETNYKLMIFNRWGEVIFISNDKLVGWDGNYLGEPAPSGVYPWVVTYEGRAQYKGPYKKTGQVTLIR